jgi:hypothetical protein
MAQGQEATTKKDSKFYLYYGLAGLGSNLGGHMPTLRVYDNKFIFTREQNSYFSKRDEKIELISEGTLQPGAIDSLLAIMQTLGDTTIFSSNPCIMSGVITFVAIAYEGDTAHFTLGNTADAATLRIKNILNPYLPMDEQLHGKAEQIEKERECIHSILQTRKERRRERRRK